MSDANAAIAYARAQIGKWYQWGATGPNTFDCSGLTMRAAQAGGVKIGRVTAQQIFNGVEVKKADLQPGDLVFPEPTHVQLYSGNGFIIEAPQTGERVRERKMWGFWRARRIFDVPGDNSHGPGNTGTTTVPAGNPITDALNAVDFWKKVITLSEDPNTWKRLGMMILGVMVVLIAIAFLNRARIASAAGGVVKTVDKAGKVAEVAAMA